VDISALYALASLLPSAAILTIVEGVILKLLKEAGEMIEQVFLSLLGFGLGIGYLWYLSLALPLLFP
jgi:hypothetical protein